MTTPELPPEIEEFKAPPKNYKAMFVIAVVVIGINILGLWLLSKK